MNLEKYRLKSFVRFPNEIMDITLLAKSGFYYSGSNETCKCFFCEIEISYWNIYTNPIVEHVKLSTGCPLLENKFTNNIPINEIKFRKMLNFK